MPATISAAPATICGVTGSESSTAPDTAADIGAAVTKTATRPADACSIAQDHSSNTPAPPTVPQNRAATQSTGVSCTTVLNVLSTAAKPKRTTRPPRLAIGTIVAAGWRANIRPAQTLKRASRAVVDRAIASPGLIKYLTAPVSN